MLTIRAATMDDARRLFEWRNDPLTRAMSFSSEEIEWDRHVSWLERRLSQEKPNLYIAEMRTVPIGTFRIDDDEISYTVAPQHRRNGLATAMLVEARHLFGVKRAKIKPENIASIRAAKSAGHEVIILPNVGQPIPPS